MMEPNFIVDVNETDFEYQVLAFSSQTPVVVDFWAEWCIPCRTLGPLLARLAIEAQGAFRLAKVDVDANPALARRYQVRSIPLVKAFRNGGVVAEFSGVQTEEKIRAFLANLTAKPEDESSLTLEKAQSYLALGEYHKAEQAFQEALLDTPDDPPALLGLSKSLLRQGRGAESAFLLRGFPASREFQTAELLLPLAQALRPFEQGQQAPAGDDPLEAAYLNALRLFMRGNIPAALDGLIDILRQDKRYRRGQTHQVVLGMLALLGEEDPLTPEYRRELALVLF